ncbi:MAG: hypothetical protein AAFU79_06375 [Myxococcota bacterium]
MSARSALSKFRRRAGRWEDETQVEVPEKVVRRLFEQRLARAGLIKRRRGLFSRVFDVSVDHWWFRPWLSGQVELTGSKKRTQLRWRPLRLWQGRMTFLGGLVLVPVVGLVWSLALLLLVSSWPFLSVMLLVGSMVMMSPMVLFMVTAGGPASARRRRRRFERNLRAIIEDTVEAAEKIERQAGQMSLAEPDEPGQLSFTEGGDG